MTSGSGSPWDAEAAWAVREWNALYEAERQQSVNAGNINNSYTYVELGKKAKRIFEIVGDKLLQRIRDQLPRQHSSDLVGNPDVVSDAVVQSGPRKFEQPDRWNLCSQGR